MYYSRRRSDPFKKILIGITCFLVIMGIVAMVWAEMDEAKHCTKWRTEYYKTMDCTFWSDGICHQYEEHHHTKNVCVERDDR